MDARVWGPGSWGSAGRRREVYAEAPLEKTTRRGGSSGDFPRGLHAGGAGALRTCSAAFWSGIGIGTTESYLSNVFIREGRDWGDGIMEGSGAVHRFQ